MGGTRALYSGLGEGAFLGVGGGMGRLNEYHHCGLQEDQLVEISWSSHVI